MGDENDPGCGNITERSRVLASLKDSENPFRELFNNMGKRFSVDLVGWATRAGNTREFW
jgi:hypothetical protein